MSNTLFKKGDVLKIPEGRYTKVIYVENNVYGISGWVFSQKNAEKANASFKRVNIFGLRKLNAEVVSSDDSVPSAEPVEEPDESPETPEPIKEPTYTKSQLEGKLKPEVVEIAKELGFNTKGTKAEVIERILTNQ